jgi:hypothetical protein
LELLPNYLASSLFPIGSLDDLWIPIGPVFHLPYNFLAWCNYIIEPVVYMAREVIKLMRANPFRGPLEGVWALKIETFLGPYMLSALLRC